MTASHPAWILAGLVSAKPKSMIKDLRIPYFAIKNGLSNYLTSAPYADSDVTIERYVRAAHSVSKAEYISVGSALHMEGDGWDAGKLYFPNIAVKSSIDARSQASDKFFAMVAQAFPGSKLYFYRSGCYVQAYLNRLIEPQEYNTWTSIVQQANEDGIVYTPWLAIGSTPTSGQRWSSGEGYPPPTLYKWHEMPGGSSK